MYVLVKETPYDNNDGRNRLTLSAWENIEDAYNEAQRRLTEEQAALDLLEQEETVFLSTYQVEVLKIPKIYIVVVGLSVVRVLDSKSKAESYIKERIELGANPQDFVLKEEEVH